jgi:hypothetical protein
MKQGVDGLATIASVAPWIGVFGTLFGIGGSFRGGNGEKSALMGALAARLSESIWPTAMGILVGLIAFFCYRYLTGRLETISEEMHTASLALQNQLSCYSGRFTPVGAIENGSTGSLFGGMSWAELDQDQKPLRHLGTFTGSALAVAWFIQIVYCFYRESLPINSAVWTACAYVLFKFGVSCLLAVPVWIKLLDRRPSGSAALAAIGSAFCLCWSIAELLFVVQLP